MCTFLETRERQTILTLGLLSNAFHFSNNYSNKDLITYADTCGTSRFRKRVETATNV